MRSKKECRKEALARRALMSAKEREAAGRRITDFLRDSEEYQLAEKILVYASYRDEVPTYDLIEGALREGKQVFCPKIEGRAGARTMSFYRIMDPEELQEGFQGIPEPVVLQGRHSETGKNSRDLILMPGTAFDRQRRRLGYGGGFYDRFCRRAQGAARIALCFDCQLLEELPEEETDIRPERIVTESGWI